MKNLKYQLSGLFFIGLGLVCLTYYSIKAEDALIGQGKTYTLTARFTSVSGLREGANVEMGGVRIGKVEKIYLDKSSYEAVVEIDVLQNLRLQEDSIASVRSRGIIGDKYIRIAPGGSENVLSPGETIYQTESSIEIEELISKYIFD
jgi:phospholipid/cholesterol/gamma-HCH transport system substrate-binding protein